LTTGPLPPAELLDAIRRGQSFVVASHQRPDGDAIGSAMAMALALRAAGKDAVVVTDAIPPVFLQPFPDVAGIQITPEVTGTFDAALIMECSELLRTGVRGLDRSPVMNIDHHPGNTSYGAINWIDESAAACGEMVFDVIRALGVPLTPEIATHIYLAILTDTGSFHHSNITPRTFDICRRAVEAGVNPAAMARRVFDSNSFGKLKLIGALLDAMELTDNGRLAVLEMDEGMLNACGCTHNDTEGVINLPLTAREIQAVVFFKTGPNGDVRVSMRSKYDVDVRSVANTYGGGGHKNAAGFTVAGSLPDVRPQIIERLVGAISEGLKSRP